jgi:uncharacterized protein (DUF58 family)
LKQNITKVKLTIYGKILLFLLVWIPIAAVVTANNFLFIIFIMMIGLGVVSDRMARNNLKFHELSRRFPEDIYAATPFPLEYIVRGPGRSRPAFALEFLENAPLENRDLKVNFYRVESVEPGHATKFFSISSRGDKRIETGTLSSAFPFNLAVYSLPCCLSEAIVVFPHIEPIGAEIPPEMGRIGSGMERADPFGTIPYNFREYVAGDPFKHIDWKKSSRTGVLITRILSEYGGREICVSLPPGASERAISRAASLIVHFGELGTPVSFRGPGIEIEAGSGREFTRKLLTILARWDNSPGETSDIQHRRGTTVTIDRTGEFVWTRPGELDEGPEKRFQIRA